LNSFVGAGLADGEALGDGVLELPPVRLSNLSRLQKQPKPMAQMTASANKPLTIEFFPHRISWIAFFIIFPPLL
jgi:hypothetical protein